jgi:hypothetical protein
MLQLTNYPNYSHKNKPINSLPYTFNIKNTTQLIQNLKEIPILPTHKCASLDISIYSNIPITETIRILEDIMEHNLINSQIKEEFLTSYDIITKQYYFIINNNIIVQNDKLIVGAPSSILLSEVYLQHLENSHIAYLAQKHRIIRVKSFLYVDDILLIFDPNHTDI